MASDGNDDEEFVSVREQRLAQSNTIIFLPKVYNDIYNRCI